MDHETGQRTMREDIIRVDIMQICDMEAEREL